MNISAVREGLADVLRTISGLRSHVHVPGQINPPAAVVGVPESLGITDYDGGEIITIPVMLVASRAGGDERAQQALDIYLDSTNSFSVRAAIEADHTLGGACDAAEYAGFSEYGGLLTVGDIEYVSVTVNVRVTG